MSMTGKTIDDLANIEGKLAGEIAGVIPNLEDKIVRARRYVNFLNEEEKLTKEATKAKKGK